MNPIHLNIPASVRAEVIYNSLYADLQMSDMTQDVALVALPGEVFIDVGWYPQRDPSGCFRIRMYQKTWANQLLNPPITTADPAEAAVQVRRLAIINHAKRLHVSVMEVPRSEANIVSGSKLTLLVPPRREVSCA